jgi:hypothetical protein
MSDSPTPTRREQLVGEIFSLYADLGWAVPTSIETARLVTLEDTVSVALNAWERRCAGLPKSAIDVHNTIQAVQREERQAATETCPTCGGEGYVGGLVISDDLPTVDERCYRCKGKGVVAR